MAHKKGVESTKGAVLLMKNETHETKRQIRWHGKSSEGGLFHQRGVVVGEEKRHNNALKLGQASALPVLRIRYAHCSASQSTLQPAG